MWQLLMLFAIFTNCAENIVDKIAMVNKVDVVVAGLIRVVFWCVLVVPISLLFGQTLTWYFDLGILAFSILSAGISIAYGQILKTVNVTSLSIFTNVVPLFFLFIDNMLGKSFTTTQVIAITGLVVGGIGFVADEKAKLDKKTIAMIMFIAGYSGGEFYYLQYLHEKVGLSGISFFMNIWFWAGVLLFILCFVQGKLKQLGSPEIRRYMKFIVFSKILDSLSSLFSGLVLTMTTVTQYSSMEAFYAPMTVLFAWTTQGWLRIELDEKMDKKTMIRKGSMVTILTISSLYL